MCYPIRRFPDVPVQIILPFFCIMFLTVRSVMWMIFSHSAILSPWGFSSVHGLLQHPAGTSEISDWKGDITNFWPIEVIERNYSGIFPLKNLQICQRSQHPFWKLVYSLKVLCVMICYQIIFKSNWVWNQRNNNFVWPPLFYQSVISDMCAQTGLNQFKLFFQNFTIANPMLWAIRITDWTLVRIYSTYLSFCHLQPISKLKSWNMAKSLG